jgi:hypothetical protein
MCGYLGRNCTVDQKKIAFEVLQQWACYFRHNKRGFSKLPHAPPHQRIKNMDHAQNPLDEGLETPGTRTQLQITEPIRRSWLEIAGWSTAFGLLFFVGVVILLLAYSRASDTYFGVEWYTTTVLVLALVFLLLIGIFYWLTGAKIRLGLEREDQNDLEGAFRNLRRVYLTWGIAIIGVVGVYALLLIVGLGMMFAGSTGGF